MAKGGLAALPGPPGAEDRLAVAGGPDTRHPAVTPSGERVGDRSRTPLPGSLPVRRTPPGAVPGEPLASRGWTHPGGPLHALRIIRASAKFRIFAVGGGDGTESE